jgi:hypothetical protein
MLHCFCSFKSHQSTNIFFNGLTAILLFALTLSFAPTKLEAPKSSNTPKAKAAGNFKISLGAFKTIQTEKLPELQKIGTVITEPAPNGLIRYFVTGFKTVADAEVQLPKLINLGYVDAKVIQASKQDPINTATTTPDITTPYKIQLGNFNSVDVRHFSRVAELGDVTSDIDNGKVRVYVGVFTGRATAQNVLTKVRELGFPEAFLKPLTANSQ